MAELIPGDELRFEAVRHNNYGGQHVGGVPTPMRVTHIPSGLEVLIPATHRSQHRQRMLAIEMLECALTSKHSV